MNPLFDPFPTASPVPPPRPVGGRHILPHYQRFTLPAEWETYTRLMEQICNDPSVVEINDHLKLPAKDDPGTIYVHMWWFQAIPQPGR